MDISYQYPLEEARECVMVELEWKVQWELVEMF